MAIDYQEAWDNAHDAQRKTPAAYCKLCGGEIYDAEEAERNDGLCLPCYYASLEPDPDDGDPDAEIENKREDGEGAGGGKQQ